MIKKAWCEMRRRRVYSFITCCLHNVPFQSSNVRTNAKKKWTRAMTAARQRALATRDLLRAVSSWVRRNENWLFFLALPPSTGRGGVANELAWRGTQRKATFRHITSFTHTEKTQIEFRQQHTRPTKSKQRRAESRAENVVVPMCKVLTAKGLSSAGVAQLIVPLAQKDPLHHAFEFPFHLRSVYP